MKEVANGEKRVFKIKMNTPKSPCYYVYSEKMANHIKDKLDEEYGNDVYIMSFVRDVKEEMTC